MARSDPFTGLVIRYDYLWDSEKKKGREEGSKRRRCAVVLVTTSGRVILCGITGTDPGDDAVRVELDDNHKSLLGLTKPSWIDCSEINETTWDDAGFEPTEDGDWEYGELDAATAQEMLDKVRAQLDAKQLAWIDRVKIEEERAKRESRS
jgi:hypothetical protein